MGAFHFVALAALRAAQLTRGCRPRVDGDHTTAVFAQREVAEGKVMALPYLEVPEPAADAVALVTISAR
jgi:DNA-directed RNA polymerase subunit K/omega